MGWEEKTFGDVVRSDNGGMSVVDSFRANCFRKKAFSCCNLSISTWAATKPACSRWRLLAVVVHSEDLQIRQNLQKVTESLTVSYTRIIFNP